MAFVCLSKRSINIKRASVLLLISLSGSHVLQGLSPLTQRCITGGVWRLWMCRYLLEYIHLTKLKIKGLMEACLSQSILPRSTNWLEGFLVMSRIDRFVCQQTFAVHRSTNVQRYMLGVKMCITAIPQQSILTDLSTSSQPESLCLSYKHFLCVCVFCFFAPRGASLDKTT